MSETRCPKCPLLLTDSEVSLVEKAIGKETVWMFNKIWEERKSVAEFLDTTKETQEVCRKENRVELRYWEAKEQEARNVIEWQTELLSSVAESLRGKIEPKLFQKIHKYVELTALKYVSSVEAQEA